MSNRVSYQRHVEAEQAYLASKACERDSRYWKKILQEPCAPVTLKDGSGAEISPVGQRLTFELPDKLNHAINAYCSAGRIARFWSITWLWRFTLQGAKCRKALHRRAGPQPRQP